MQRKVCTVLITGFFLVLLLAQQRTLRVSPSGEVVGNAHAFYPNSWALVIGINEYQKAPKLNYATADARAVAELLPRLGFSPGNVRLLLDREATKGRIESALYREFAAMGPEDRLFVFFAGHGETRPIRDGEEAYLLPVDADPEALPPTAFPWKTCGASGRG